MHLNTDHLYIEFLSEDGTPAAPGEPGHLVVTDLINKGMPLIRYRVEDVGIPTNRQCPCGRGLPLLERVTGRVADFLKKADGSLVAGISLIERTLTAIKGIEQMQIVQPEIHKIAINIVRDIGYDSDTEAALLDEFRRVFGDSVTVTLNYVSTLSQDSSGKYGF